MIEQVLDLLISAQLLGFGIWCVYYCINAGNEFVSRFDIVVTFITRIVGMLFVTQMFIVFFKVFFSSAEYQQYTFADLPFGKYWLSFWLTFFIPLLATQVLWIKTLRSMRYLRLGIGIILIGILSLEKIIVIVTSVDRDFIPQSVQNSLIYEALLSSLYLLLVFIALNFIIYFTVSRYFNALRS